MGLEALCFRVVRSSVCVYVHVYDMYTCVQVEEFSDWLAVDF